MQIKKKKKPNQNLLVSQSKEKRVWTRLLEIK